MNNKVITRRDAAQKWINNFNAIPTHMIAKLWNADPEDWEEVTSSEFDDYYEQLPMWGIMWSFRESFDNYWLENENGIEMA